MRPLFALACASLFGCTVVLSEGGCSSAGTLENAALVGVETDQARQCVDRFSPDAAAEHECRAAVTATWDKYWAARYPDSGLFEAGKVDGQ